MTSTSNAQIRGVYSISCIGDTDKGLNVFSSPVAISKGTCLRIETGAATFQAPAVGIFLDACLNNVYINNTGQQFSIFPNPFKTTVTVRLLVPLANDDKISISVYGINGQLYKTQVVGSAELLAGYPFNLTYLSQGTYVLNILFQKQSEAYQIIKIN